MPGDTWIIGITGASGTVYARRLVQALVQHVPGVRLDVVISPSALRVMRDEEGLDVAPGRLSPATLFDVAADGVALHLDRGGHTGSEFDRRQGAVHFHSHRNIGAAIASGSYLTRGMVVVPCSMKTLAAIAHGYGENLIARAADVVLKERRPLIVVPRETPLSALHLKNMLALARLGAAIVPAMPGFYHRPASIADLVDLLVMRILDQMGYHIDLSARWTGPPRPPAAAQREHRPPATAPTADRDAEGSP